MKIYPKGTTKAQWDQYDKELIEHEDYFNSIRPKSSDFPDYISWNLSLTQWIMNKAQFAPKKPNINEKA